MSALAAITTIHIAKISHLSVNCVLKNSSLNILYITTQNYTRMKDVIDASLAGKNSRPKNTYYSIQNYMKGTTRKNTLVNFAIRNFGQHFNWKIIFAFTQARSRSNATFVA